MTLPRIFRATLAISVLAATLPGGLGAQTADIPLTNWTVPPYTASSSGGIHTMVDQTPPRAFIGLPVCRLLDTRPPANNPLDGDGAFAPNATRQYTLPGACGIPVGADAVSLNITATNTGAQPFGHIKVWPVGQTEPNVSTLNYPGPGATIANAAIVPLGTGGAINVKSGEAGADILMDVNGYFSDLLGSANSLVLTSPVSGDGTIQGINTASANGTAAVKGVQGAAVPGTASQPPSGVVGTSSLFNGVLGLTQVGSGGAGVKGERLNVTPPTSGELGVANLGGLFHNDVEIVDGDLRVTKLDLASRGDIEADGNVTIDGNLSVAGGSKMFVEPHPTDASKIIRYVSLEGPESGTYFRGRGRFQNGIARIPVPEDFRFVTAEDGLTVQITPIGGMATVGVLRMDLNEIVAQSSRNLEFSYLVQGVRRALQDFRVMDDAGILFVRRGTASRLSKSLPEEMRRRLIANGTYNADGTVNMETARRLGWEQIWAEQKREQPAVPQTSTPEP